MRVWVQYLGLPVRVTAPAPVRDLGPEIGRAIGKGGDPMVCVDQAVSLCLTFGEARERRS
jgi:hypothetical protein